MAKRSGKVEWQGEWLKNRVICCKSGKIGWWRTSGTMNEYCKWFKEGP